MKNSNISNKFVLILAGGNGTRLWPISLKSKPKQFLNLYGNNIMINETIKRVESIFEYKNIFIIINKEQEEIASRYIDYNIPRENIFCEPSSKNTAMCIFYATLKIKDMRGNGTITVLSSDHYIEQKEKLIENIKDGIDIANTTENLVTIGIKPSYPSTGFGYIKFHYDKTNNYNIVEEFKEKPNYENALKYIESKEYFWNSGMFIWNIDTILKSFKKFLPDLYKYQEEIKNVINTKKEFNTMQTIYNKIQAISIDKGILEKSDNIKMIRGEFEWLDIGTINDFFKIQEKDQLENTQLGNILAKETKKTNVLNKDENCLIVTIGIENINIVNCNNVILIANKDKMNKLPVLTEEIKNSKKYNKYL
ncbi:MAG: mannose-1-phosphate guanylyltransferase [Clostridia bacterium]|nr:mannose-1-phosphate guanylyltransferase [Clostridia bacterium]